MESSVDDELNGTVKEQSDARHGDSCVKCANALLLCETILQAVCELYLACVYLFGLMLHAEQDFALAGRVMLNHPCVTSRCNMRKAFQTPASNGLLLRSRLLTIF